MDYLVFFNEHFFYGGFIGIIAAILLFIFKLLIKSFPNFPPFNFLRKNIVKYKALKLERSGFKVLLYLSWIDGLKTKVTDLETNKIMDFDDPLSFEQDKLKHLPVSVKNSFVFYNKNELSIKGYFHRINSNSKEVYSGQITNTKLREE